MSRALDAAPGLALFALVLAGAPALRSQMAVSFSRPGQEDLTFWVHRSGLSQIDVEGEVGFGDLARILMRRRSNAESLRPLRDRYLFRNRDIAAVQTPDLFRAEITREGLAWRHRPRRVIAAAAGVYNLPLVVNNLTDERLPLEARLTGGSLVTAHLPPRTATAYFLKITERSVSAGSARLRVGVGGRELAAEIPVDLRPMAKLRVQLVDENGRPAAARVYLTGADGLAYAPRGAINRYAPMAAEPYFHAEDSFLVELPAGRTVLEAVRGQEYRLVRREVDLEAGMTAELQLPLARWENMAARGWYSADSHIHANSTAEHHQVITAEDVRLYVSAEDLNNANLMVANSSGAFIHDQQLFEGKPNAVSRPDRIIYWNEEMRGGPLFGHIVFFSLRSLVAPLYTGFRDTPHAEDHPPNVYQAAAAQQQGAAVAFAHPAMSATFDATNAKELPVDVALGQVDALDVLSSADEFAAMELWYRLLNCGFHVAISAGTDAYTNVADHFTPGAGRVYVWVGDQMRYAEWIRHYKQGRSFASNGPVILFTLAGHGPGETVEIPEGGPQRLRVKATVSSQVTIDKVDVVVNGQAVVTRGSGGQTFLSIDEDITLRGSSWVAVRATGPGHRLVLNDTHAFAHTSPVYVQSGKQRLAHRADVRFYIDWIERLIARTQERGRFATPAHRKEVLDVFERALGVYRGLL